MCPESESFEGWVMIWLKCSEYDMIKHFRVFLSFFNYIRICLAFPFKFSEMSKFLFSRRSDPDVLSGSQQQAKRPVYKISLLLCSLDTCLRSLRGLSDPNAEVDHKSSSAQ